MMIHRVYRKWVVPCIAVLCLLFVSTQASAITITHMHYSSHNPAWLEWLQERAAAYEELNPDIHIDIVVSPGGQASVNQLLNMVAARAPPDVTELPLVYGGATAELGIFKDLGPYVMRDPDVSLDMFAPIGPEATTWTNGQLWGLPLELYTSPVYFNRNLLGTDRSVQGV